jgi:hypothetical protein
LDGKPLAPLKRKAVWRVVETAGSRRLVILLALINVALVDATYDAVEAGRLETRRSKVFLKSKIRCQFACHFVQ